ncbi:HEAT repeat domain-containing protein [Xanthomonas axonopodis pv. poinsettiicola]|uniref:HEAT repeat domain-containing protein n=1 Tax=Xanthomonas TaxID=338 RepID=UPI001E5F8A7A|nr:HEAT repeat domain-containing protein [Xanthomonas codiaei]MCC8536222.1 HEAT repeat domain-containing protein [Xanthomonas codiaei]
MKGRKTAAELMAELNVDNEYLEMRRARDIAHENSIVAHAKESAPVVAALNLAGVEVNAIWELSEDGRFDEKAVPVLIEQLTHDYSDSVREEMLRGLATPYARAHWDQLVEIFEKNSLHLSPKIRYVAALALSGAADDTVLDDVIRLLGDKSLGMDRAPLLLALIRSKSSKAKMTLLELRDDPDLGKQIKTFRRIERHQKAISASK